MSQSFYDRISNSRFYNIGDKLGDIILLSVLWILTSLPIVTMGVATTSLYYAIHKRFVDQSETPVKDYFRSFKQNFKQGLVLNIVLLLYAAITSFNILVTFFGWNGIKLPSWFMPVSILLLLPLVFSVPYVFPYLARFSNTSKSILFHSFTFATMYPGHTLIMWLYILLSIALSVVFFPALLFLPFTCCYLCHRVCERDFNYALLLRDKREHPEKYADEIKEDDVDEDEDEDEDEDLEEEDEEESSEEDDPDEDSDEDSDDDSDDESEEEPEEESGSEDAAEEKPSAVDEEPSLE